MIIENITCPLDVKGKHDSGACHNALLLKYPSLIGVTHQDNNHIVTLPADYDAQGHLNPDIHTLAWQIGAVIVKDKTGNIIQPPPISQNNLIKSGTIKNISAPIGATGAIGSIGL